MSIHDEILGNTHNSNKSESKSQKSGSSRKSNRSNTKSITKEEIEISSSSAKKTNLKNGSSPQLQGAQSPQDQNPVSDTEQVKSLQSELQQARQLVSQKDLELQK